MENKEAKKRNLVVYDKEGYTYNMNGEFGMNEDFILNELLNAYEEAGVITVNKKKKILLYFGINSNPRVWEYNPFLSHIAGEPVYSNIGIFVDAAEIGKSPIKMDYETFYSSVEKYINDEWNKICKEQSEKNPPRKRSKKYGFLGIKLHLNSIQSIEIPTDDLDDFFETHYKGKYASENIIQNITDCNTGQIFTMMWRPGSVCFVDENNDNIECYFHGNYDNTFTKTLN